MQSKAPRRVMSILEMMGTLTAAEKTFTNGRFPSYGWCVLIASLLFSGCATTVPILPTEDVTTQTMLFIHADPLHVLLTMPTGWEKVKARVHNPSLAHMFISSS